MAINVNVSGGGTIVASVDGADSADVAVSGQSDPIAVAVTGGIGPAALVSGTATSVIGVNQVTAGQYISISTASGMFAISANPPVLSVQGRTGNISLAAADLTAAAASHTHAAAQISNLTTVANVVSVNGRTGTVSLVASDLTAAAASHTHAAASISDLTTVANVVSVNGQTGAVNLVAGSNVTVAASSGSVVISTGSSLPAQGGKSGPLVTDGTAASWVSRFSIVDPVLVQGEGITLTRDSSAGSVSVSSKVLSVNGRTGNVSLVAADLTAAAASHTHTAAQVSDLTTVANVVSVNGRTGTVSLVASDLTAAAASHTHTAAQISNLTTVANVVSVNGRTGTVSLVASDLTAASASHTHTAAQVSDLTTVANVVSVNGRTGTVSLVASDLTAASTSHAHPYVTSLNNQTGTLSIVAGPNVTVTTAVGTLTVASGNSIDLSNVTPQPLGTAAPGDDALASRADHVHAMPTAADVGALDSNSIVDGGDYVGVVVGPSITITQHPQNTTATQSGFLSTAFSLPSGSWTGVTRAGGKWFATPSNTDGGGDYIATSDNGTTWTTTQLAFSTAKAYRRPLYYNGVWMTYSTGLLSSDWKVVRSTNGTSWSDSSNQRADFAVVVDGVGFVRWAQGSNQLYFSADANTWTAASFPGGSAVAAASDSRIAVATWPGSGFPIVSAASASGTTLSAWTSAGFAAAVPIGIAFSPTSALAYSDGYSATFDFTAQSPAWSGVQQINGYNNGVRKVCWAGSRWVAACNGLIRTSSDGVSWATRYSTGSADWVSIAAVGSNVVALNSTGGAIFSSDGGINWEAKTLNVGASETAVSLASVGDLILAETNMDDTSEGGSIIDPDGNTVASFSVAASVSPSGTLAYQWQRSDDGGATWANVSGGTSTLSLIGLTNAADNGDKYRCIVSASGAAPVISNAATLTVT